MARTYTSLSQHQGSLVSKEHSQFDHKNGKTTAIINKSTGQVGTLDDAVNRINQLEEENKTKEELIKKLERDDETKNYLWKDVFRRMNTDINQLKQKKNNSDYSKKLKELKNKLRLSNKNTDEANKTNENLNQKLGQEVLLRAHAEKEVIRLTQCQSINQ